MRHKPYKSERWLKLQYCRFQKSPEEIAETCGVTPMTIYRALNEFGIKR